MARSTTGIYVCEDDGTLGDGILIGGGAAAENQNFYQEIILETTAAVFIVPGANIDVYIVECIEEIFDA